ncbi:MAG: sigma 54-interacting transcriptional regulator [Polyangiaceae bacterium]|nr:sigma 54-interacting transcriptional regulator [Polyangiaceae bacterium]
MAELESDTIDASALTLLRARPEDLPKGVFTVHVHGSPSVALTVDGSAPGPLIIGSSRACDLVVPDAAVSRRHLSLELVGGALLVKDLASKNGTIVNGLEIREAMLRGGEQMTIGGATLLVARYENAPNPPVPFARAFGRLLGESRAMRRLYPLCERLAATTVPVLIEGETGTGKEVLAEAIHEQGPRAKAPFVVFDCTTVPANLVESELFGHERGSFTGAAATRKGVFEQADGGTLLIDEIGDLDVSLQPKLLRAIERREVRRVGGDRFIGVDVRILSATRRDLEAEVQAGRFRDDLFHRLAVTRVTLPPLRSRRADIPMLAEHFFRQAGGSGELPPALTARLTEEAWPGNVRELRNAVARYVALGLEIMLPEPDDDAPATKAADLAPTDFIAQVLTQELPLAHARARVVEEFERRYLERILEANGGVVTRAAEASGIARRHFQRLRARSR